MKPFDAIRILSSAGGALLAQARLHGQLVRVEWEEEKIRLLKLLVAALLVFSGLLCFMLFAGIAVLAASWDSGYRIAVAVTLVAVYALGAALAWLWFKALAARQSFAATREELAADLALLRSTH
jgi:uncharacterized membrane protein YqjE